MVRRTVRVPCGVSVVSTEKATLNDVDSKLTTSAANGVASCTVHVMVRGGCTLAEKLPKGGTGILSDVSPSIDRMARSTGWGTKNGRSLG